MRIPKIASRNISNNTDNKEKHLEINMYSKCAMITDDEWKTDDKAYRKFVKKIEKVVRGSLEYKRFIKFLKEEINMNQCSYFKNIDRTSLYGISIEIHHAPFTLYDITSIVIAKMLKDKKDVSVFSVAEEVLKLHFKGLIGMIPLSYTVHELVHKGDIFVPIQNVYGNVKTFIDEYEDVFTDEQSELLDKNIEASKNIEGYAPKVLEKVYTYITVDGMEFPKKLETEEIKIS